MKELRRWLRTLEVTAHEAPHDNRPLILIVDDTPANLSVLVDLLSAHHFAVSVAEDGESALEQVDYIAPDLILLDVLMPHLDGYATCAQLKSKAGYVRDSGHLHDRIDRCGEQGEGVRAGAVDYITKPFQHEEVMARITMHLTLLQLRRRLQENEERLSRILESAMDAIVTLDAGGRVVFFNRAAETMFRCSAGVGDRSTVRTLFIGAAATDHP